MTLTQRIASFAALAVVAAISSSAHAAISFTGTPYTQNFDSFAGAATNLAFTNDSTLPGLELYLSGNQYSTTTSATDAVQGIPDYIARNSGTTSSSFSSLTYRGTGTTALTSAHYFYRPTAGSTDVALGFFNTDNNSRGVTPPSQGYASGGFALTNNTGAVQNGFQLFYTAEASTSALTNADPVNVSYSLDAVGVGDGDGTWTDVPGMGYSVSPAGVVTQQTVNSLSGITWLPGQTLTIRFRDANVGFTDRFSWVDDITIAPEPTSIAFVGLAGTALIRRRHAR